MADVLLLSADLLFGSNVQGALAAAGHDVRLLGGEAKLRDQLSVSGESEPRVLVVDLTDQQLDGAGIVRSLRGEALLAGTRTLGFYSHVELASRERAEAVGFDLVVPRSRMAREGAELVSRIAAPGFTPPA